MRHPSRLLLAAFILFLFGVAALTSAVKSADASEAQRIVIAGGDLTEIAYALGAEDRVIAVDSTSNYPPEVSEKDQIGYVRRLTAEGILSLAPDMLLAADDAGPETALTQLEGAGVRIAKAPEAATVDKIADKIRFVGSELGAEADANALADRVNADLAEIAGKVATLSTSPRVLFILSLDRGTPLAGGVGTSAAEMIARAGGTNAAEGFEGYKPISREAILQAAPDVILMMSQHAGRAGGLAAVLERAEFALTPAGKSGNAVAIEGMLLLGFGPRTPSAIAELARAIHKDAAAQAGL
ncbi:MAG: ABC transporter substrate-binding protein [Pseudomonadota bacterium]